MEQYLTAQTATHILPERLAAPMLAPAGNTSEQVINMGYAGFPNILTNMPSPEQQP